jgi:DnaJ-class molecular chaperone
MEKPECPRCKKTGKIKEKGRGVTITCPLCKGLGEIPPLHVIHEVCEKCGAKQLQAERESIKQRACPRKDERVK